MQTKFILTVICFIIASTSIYMIFFGETFPTATAFQQRSIIVMAIIGTFGIWYFGKEVFELEN